MKKFDKYVCVGDCVEKEFHGLTLRAELLHDEFVTPDEYDCYTDEQIADWKRGEWFFGGLVISLWCDDIEIESHLSSLWGLYCNIVDDHSYLDEVAEELFGEAESEAMKVVSKLANKLSESVKGGVA